MRANVASKETLENLEEKKGAYCKPVKRGRATHYQAEIDVA